VNKRLFAGLMAGALFLGGAASATIEVNVPTTRVVDESASDDSVSAEGAGAGAAADVMGQMQDLLHDELVLTAEEARLVSGDSGPRFDLSGLSYEELVALKDCINLAIWESEEWQEVTVPQGVWVVGEDIPAGKWTIKCVDGAFRTEICWGDYLSEDGTSVSDETRGEVYVYISNPEHRLYEAGDMTEYTVTLQVGDYVEVASNEDAAVFMPYAGKPSLGFK